MIFRCRTTVPAESVWSRVEAESPEGAANEFWFHQHQYLRRVSWRIKDGPRVHFAVVQVEGNEGLWVARVFDHGPWRRSGVPAADEPTSLAQVAERLGWTKDPAMLIQEGWGGEESEQEAERRKYRI